MITELSLKDAAALLGVKPKQAKVAIELNNVKPCRTKRYDSGNVDHWWTSAAIEKLKATLEEKVARVDRERLAAMMPREYVRVAAPPVDNTCPCDNLAPAIFHNGDCFVCWRCLGSIAARRVPVMRLPQLWELEGVPA